MLGPGSEYRRNRRPTLRRGPHYSITGLLRRCEGLRLALRAKYSRSAQEHGSCNTPHGILFLPYRRRPPPPLLDPPLLPPPPPNEPELRVLEAPRLLFASVLDPDS